MLALTRGNVKWIYPSLFAQTVSKYTQVLKQAGLEVCLQVTQARSQLCGPEKLTYTLCPGFLCEVQIIQRPTVHGRDHEHDTCKPQTVRWVYKAASSLGCIHSRNSRNVCWQVSALSLSEKKKSSLNSYSTEGFMHLTEHHSELSYFKNAAASVPGDQKLPFQHTVPCETSRTIRVCLHQIDSTHWISKQPYHTGCWGENGVNVKS